MKKVKNPFGEKSRNWKGGLCLDKEYISWLKNKKSGLRKFALGSHTYGEWKNLKAQYNWICAYCKRKEPEIKLTQDHIIPISKGGSNNIENIQPLCDSCNKKKYNKLTNP